MGWDLGNILSAIGILASVINTLVVIYIYTKWTTQKRKEVVANDASILLKEIDSFRQDILKAHKKGKVDTTFISYMAQKKSSIGYALAMIRATNKGLVYKHYTDSLSVLIAALEVDPESISKTATIDDVVIYSYDLYFKLERLRLYL